MRKYLHLIIIALTVAICSFHMPVSVHATDLEEETVTVKKSADNSLDELKISGAELSPDFYYSTVNYTATVSYEVTSVKVSTRTSNPTATVESVSGNENLVVGENKIRIVVVAENGNKATYTIKLTRLAEGESVSQTVDEEQMEENNSSSEEEPLNPADVQISLGNTWFKLAEAPQEVILSSATEVDLELEGIGRIRAFQYLDGTIASSKNEEDFYLVYGVDEAGEYGWYQYDRQSNSFQRYNERIIVQTVVEENTELMQAYNLASVENSQLKQKICTMSFVFLFIVGILLVIMFSVLWSKRNTDYEEDIFEENPKAPAKREIEDINEDINEDILEEAEEIIQVEEITEAEDTAGQIESKKTDKKAEIGEKENQDCPKKAKRKGSILAYLGLDDDLPLDFGDVIEDEEFTEQSDAVVAEKELAETEGYQAKREKKLSKLGKKPAKNSENDEDDDIEFINL